MTAYRSRRQTAPAAFTVAYVAAAVMTPASVIDAWHWTQGCAGGWVRG